MITGKEALFGGLFSIMLHTLQRASDNSKRTNVYSEKVQSFWFHLLRDIN